MLQLTEVDNSFIQMESNRTPMHISPVIFYDQSGVKRGKVRFKEILKVFERSLPKSAVFRRKLVGGALGFDTPYWIEDSDFDLEFHVRHIALTKPGDWRQLCILMARVQARGLDMSRPLWEAYVIEGLNEVQGLPAGSFAIMLKIHHAAIDGVSAAEILTSIHSLTDEPEPPEMADDWHGEDPPSPMQVWSRAYLNTLKRPVKLLEAVGELIPRAIQANRGAAERQPQDKPSSVKTRFNTRVSGYRVTDAIILNLATVKAIKAAAPGATINDVMVSIVGGAMRKYLQAKGELPETSLVSGTPINVRAERNSDSDGNQVGFMTIDMATDVEAPLERLQAVAHHAQESKAYSSAIGANSLMDISKGLPPPLLGVGMRVATLAVLNGDLSVPVHTVVSNVPGPQVPLYLAGARMHMLMGLGPIMDMMGLFHAVISGAGIITINFVACRELLPDPGFYKECLQQAYDELEAAAIDKPARKKRRRRGRGRQRIANGG